MPEEKSHISTSSFDNNQYLAIENEIQTSDRKIRASQATLADKCSLLDYSSLVVSVDGENCWGHALQTALTEHEIVVIPPRCEKYYIEVPVEIPSNRRIEASGATICLSKHNLCLMFKSSASADGTLCPIENSPRGSNIAITGGTWCDTSTCRRGYGVNGMFNSEPRRIGNYYGVSTLFYFGNTDCVSITEATFVSCGAFAIQCGDGDGFLFDHIRFENCFADGLHFNGNLSHVHARDIKGMVGDDLVALNAYDWLNSSVNFGPQQWFLCEDLELRLKNGIGYPAIRIQPACYKFKDGSIIDCAVRNVIFRNVRGVETFKMYLQTPPYKIGVEPEWSRIGSGGNIFFDDIKIDLSGPIDNIGQYITSDPLRGHFGAFEFGADLSSVYFRNIDITFHCDKFPLAHLMTVGPKSIVFDDGTGNPPTEIFDPYVDCTVEKVVLENIRCHGSFHGELIHSTVFNDINHDGNSSGRGQIIELSQTQT